jgi:hypothetical protein
MADRWGRWDRERERAGAAENNNADRVGPRDRERERERARPRTTALTGLVHGTERETTVRMKGQRRQAWPTGRLALTGGARLSSIEGARAQARAWGWAGLG